mmetsp:Transcript_17790/g.42833  ORF Transcript_17790/g.42833 Transcript_17790/m.42833 type:complete len:217 (-) Transcript_17790:163-813(-)
MSPAPLCRICAPKALHAMSLLNDNMNLLQPKCNMNNFVTLYDREDVISVPPFFLLFARLAIPNATKNAPTNNPPRKTWNFVRYGPTLSSNNVTTFFCSRAPGSSSYLSTERQCGPVYPLLHLQCLPVDVGTPNRPGVAVMHWPFGVRSMLDSTLESSVLTSTASSATPGLSRPAVGSSFSSDEPAASFIGMLFSASLLFLDWAWPVFLSPWCARGP